ncbi:MAG: 30S ribosomal protein S4 [Candidatus Omnitrophica bacterium 4484_213]|nr:MAG: 30S ribosomal protein S4 [Candidatus Omnitrophica bacterium 4484_213]
MAKYIGPKCRLCRRERMKLFLKGARCQGDKCSFSRRAYSPGQQGKSGAKLSDYGLQLREKQKVKRIYGILERQFRFYFRKAEQMKGATGENLLVLLERRLDNVIFRSSFAVSHSAARQLVRHNFIYVNGKRVNIPSYLVNPGDKIEFKKEKSKDLVKRALEVTKERDIPGWIKRDERNLCISIVHLPKREDIQVPIQEQLIVELYSK